jgi:hypothetical protein
VEASENFWELSLNIMSIQIKTFIYFVKAPIIQGALPKNNEHSFKDLHLLCEGTNNTGSSP